MKIILWLILFSYTLFCQVQKSNKDIDTTISIKDFNIRGVAVNYFNGYASNSYLKDINFVNYNDRILYNPKYFSGLRINWFRFANNYKVLDNKLYVNSLKEFDKPFFSLKYVQSGMDYIFFGLNFSRLITKNSRFSLIINGAKNDSGTANFWYNVPNKLDENGDEVKYYNSKNGELAIHVDLKGEDFFDNSYHLMYSNFIEQYTKESWRLNSYDKLENYYLDYDSNYTFIENKYYNYGSKVDSTLYSNFYGFNYRFSSLFNTEFKYGFESREPEMFSKYKRIYFYLNQPLIKNDYFCLLINHNYDYYNVLNNYHKNYSFGYNLSFLINEISFSSSFLNYYRGDKAENKEFNFFTNKNIGKIDTKLTIFYKKNSPDYTLQDSISANIPIHFNNDLQSEIVKGAGISFNYDSLLMIQGKFYKLDNYISAFYNTNLKSWQFLNYYYDNMYKTDIDLQYKKRFYSYLLQVNFKYSDFLLLDSLEHKLYTITISDNYRYKALFRIGKMFEILKNRFYAKLFLETEVSSSSYLINYIGDDFLYQPLAKKFNFYSNISIKQFDLFFNIYNFTNEVYYNNYNQKVNPLSFVMGLNWRLFK